MAGSGYESEDDYNLAAFSFGNVDKFGNLEDNSYFDSTVEPKHIKVLRDLGCGPIIQDMIGAEQIRDSFSEGNSSLDDITYYPSSKDYSDFKEMAKDESLDENYYKEENNVQLTPLPSLSVQSQKHSISEPVKATDSNNVEEPLALMMIEVTCMILGFENGINLSKSYCTNEDCDSHPT